MIKRMKTEEGVVIVEATIIFPIVFLIVFLMIFLGNAYFQKSRVEEIVTKMTYYGSAQCADPLLKYVQEKAIEILQDDKKLEKEENINLKNCIKEKFSKVEL